MAAPLLPGASRATRALRFCDLLEDNDPTKLSWTKIGLAVSTICTAATTAFATIESISGHLHGTDWAALSGSLIFHGLTSTKHELKRRAEAGVGQQ